MSTITKINHLGTSKLVQLIKTLSAKELKELKDWLESPWCKTNKYHLPFYELLYQAAPKFEAVSLLKTSIFKQLYEGKNYNNAIFNNLILSLTKEVQRYLAFLFSHQSKEEQPQFLRKYLLERNAIALYETETQTQIKKLKKQPAKSAKDYLLLNRLHQELYFQPSSKFRYKNEAPHLVVANDYLDAFYLLEKYKYLHESKARTKILKTEGNGILKENLPLLEDLQNHLALDAVPLYIFRLQNKQEVNLKDYTHFKELYLKAFPKLPYTLQQSFLVFCINDAIYLDVVGYPNAMEELFNWYKVGLSNHLLVEHGTINKGTFNNIILTACHVEQDAFLKEFIENYWTKLPAIIRKEAYQWSQAQLALVLGAYEQVIAQFGKWLPKDKLYAIQSKITLLKANFKLVLLKEDVLQTFVAHCQAFEKYMQRNTLFAPEKTTAYVKYIQYVRKMAVMSYALKRKQQWKKLELAIEQEPLLIGKSWLKKELNQLKGNKSITKD